MPQDDDYQLQNYQDDLDTKGVDTATHAVTDDPTKTLGVPPREFKKELERLDPAVTGDETPESQEDMDSMIEDMNEGD